MINSIDTVDAWHLKRWEKITASEWYKLMPGGRPSPESTIFSVAGVTYIETKVMEMETEMWERPELENFKNFLHGKAEELPAFEEYVSETRNTSMAYCGSYEPVFIPYGLDAGGSPDAAQTENRRIVYGAEFKCPINPLVHSRNRRIKDQWELKEKHPQAYGQCQFLIKITGADGWDWVSFDRRVKLKSGRKHIIQCLPDKNYLASTDVRLQQAIKLKYQWYYEKNPQ